MATNSYTVTQAPHPDYPDLTAVTLASSEDFAVTFIPDAGMVGSSMVHRGDELLGMRAGLGPYLEAGKTFGIPLLAPWANRLVASSFDGITLATDDTPGVHLDGNGLPIHGLLAGSKGWVITRCEAVDEGPELGAWLSAQLDFNSGRPEFPAFPFPHTLAVTVHLSRTRVQIETSVEPTTDQEVPIAFGWHPYFAPPGRDRQDWAVAKPFTHHVTIDDRCIPTGEVERQPVTLDLLGDAANGGLVYDDLFCDVSEGTKAWVEGGGRRITLQYDSGYPYAVLFAPPDQALVAIEPMTAPTDPLAGHFPIRTAKPGLKSSAIFSIVVTAAGTDA